MQFSRKPACCDAGAGDKIPSEPECGRYIHFYARSVLDGRARGFGAYINRDGSGYSAALILVCRKALPDDIATAEGFEAMLRREFKNLPKVSLQHTPHLTKAFQSTRRDTICFNHLLAVPWRLYASSISSSRAQK